MVQISFKRKYDGVRFFIKNDLMRKFFECIHLRCLCTISLEYHADGLTALRTDDVMLGERRGQRQQLDRIFQFHRLRVHHAAVTVRAPRLRHPSPPVVDSCSGQSPRLRFKYLFGANKQMFCIVLYQNARFVSIHIEKYFEKYFCGRRREDSAKTKRRRFLSAVELFSHFSQFVYRTTHRVQFCGIVFVLRQFLDPFSYLADRFLDLARRAPSLNR